VLDKRLVESLSRAFDVDPSVITPETTQANTPSWDSLGHLKLVFEIEDAFGIRLSSEEITTVTSVARLQDVLFRHQAIRA
jgi:acyl carrier protein